MKSFLKYWLPLLVWLGLIFIGSTDLMSAEHTSRIIGPILRWFRPDISAETVMQVQFLVRKTGHVTEYAILAMLIWRALRRSAVPRMKMSILRPVRLTLRAGLRSGQVLFLTVLVACGLFAASDEFHQSFVSSRTASANDVMIDALGALIGLTICVAAARRKVLKEKHAS